MERIVASPDYTGAIVFFDGKCLLCIRAVKFILRHDRRKRFCFASLQGKTAEKIVAMGEEEPTPESIVLFSNDHIYTRSSAVFQIARWLRFPINCLYLFIIIPVFLRDGLYLFIARRRYRWFGKQESCYVPGQENISRFLE
jgi:predicted DCC family thiol-disulfide oxidoreductase YuxK